MYIEHRGLISFCLAAFVELALLARQCNAPRKLFDLLYVGITSAQALAARTPLKLTLVDFGTSQLFWRGPMTDPLDSIVEALDSTVKSRSLHKLFVKDVSGGRKQWIRTAADTLR